MERSQTVGVMERERNGCRYNMKRTEKIQVNLDICHSFVCLFYLPHANPFNDTLIYKTERDLYMKFNIESCFFF